MADTTVRPRVAYYSLPVWWTSWDIQEAHPESRDETLRFIRSLDLDPNRLLPEATVVEYLGGYELHAWQEVETPDGRPRVDPFDEDKLMCERIVIPVAEGSWPAMPAGI
jgi:hypothetical protein